MRRRDACSKLFLLLSFKVKGVVVVVVFASSNNRIFPFEMSRCCYRERFGRWSRSRLVLWRRRTRRCDACSFWYTCTGEREGSNRKLEITKRRSSIGGRNVIVGGVLPLIGGSNFLLFLGQVRVLVVANNSSSRWVVAMGGIQLLLPLHPHVDVSLPWKNLHDRAYHWNHSCVDHMTTSKNCEVGNSRS